MTHTKPVIFMFSGQGSQYYQMGSELYANHPGFRRWMDRLDETARPRLGIALVDELYGASQSIATDFDHPIHTHPAIFMVEYALARVLLESGLEPEMVLGASLGEFTAGAIGGMFDPDSLIPALIRQAEVIDSRCVPGGMTTVVHDPRLFGQQPELYENAEMAARNYPAHFVVSGERESLAVVETFLLDRGVTYLQLPVAHAFHSGLMDPVKPDLLALFGSLNHGTTDVPLVSCATSRRMDAFPAEHWWDVVRQPVEFQDTITALEKEGAYRYVDLGPAGTLANFVKHNLSDDSASEVYHILSPFGQGMKNLEKVMHRLSENPRVTARGNRASRSAEKDRKIKDQKMVTWVFPGQGSQKKGMGGPLFDEFSDITAAADELLGYSIKELCMDDPKNLLVQTEYTQPALFVVNALSYYKKTKDTGVSPDFVTGHSLGEYSALLAAGGIDFETGLKLVQRRGELMSRATGGAMAAVVNCDEAEILRILADNGLTGVDIANYNAPSQIVISGVAREIEQAVSIFKEARIAAIPLNVSGAFHSRLMEEARVEFEGFLKGFTFHELKIPVISNVHARPYRQADIALNLSDQITHSVKWTESIRFLMGKGEMDFEEIGPGNVLTNLIAKIRKEAEPLIVEEDEIPQTGLETETKQTGPEASHDASSHPIAPESLGSEAFRTMYGTKYAYAAGAMVRGIASKELVVCMGKAGLIGYLGTGGLDIPQIEQNIQYIQNALPNGQAYGMNLLSNISHPDHEERLVDLYLKHDIRNVEASAYMQVTPALVRYRLTGLRQSADGVAVDHRIMAKVSRPEVAEAFLSPAPEKIVGRLLEHGRVTEDQARLAEDVPMADALCVEADSAGHTDQGNITVLLPAMLRLQADMREKHGYSNRVLIGAAGGIGTPEAAASAFVLGADFILTGSINQCTVEAGTSDAVKDILQQINVQDTDYAPAADMFEFGAKVQVVRKGVFFPARANKLFDLYRHYNDWYQIDDKTRQQIQDRYFRRSFEDIYEDTQQFFARRLPEEIERAERNPKHKMALVFRWYLFHTLQIALEGDLDRKVDFQIHCGPALGAFNQWVKGTPAEDWRNRHADEIAVKLMRDTAELLYHRFQSLRC